MRLDHVSYVASHDQISDVVNRIGSQIRTTFVDGGIHPKFGTRNFTAPLLNGQYIEVVCPLNHPATEVTPFGRAVKKKTEEGGGWLTWVIAVDNIKFIEEIIGRNATDGQRKKPDGTELNWKQLGVLDTINDASLPFYVEWISKNHPSLDGKPVASISSINISSNQEQGSVWENLKEIKKSKKFNLTITPPGKNEGQVGITGIELDINSNKVLII